MEPGWARITYLLGRSLYSSGNTQEAIGALRQSVRLDSKVLQPHLILGAALDQMKNTSEAETEWRAALAIDPKSTAALRSLSKDREMAGMGVGVGDYDLDSHLDIVRTHFQNQSTGLYHNLGKGQFEDVTAQAGLALERRFINWGPGLVDLDNDGYPDILLVAGTVYPELEPVYPKYPRRGPLIVFRNQGNGKFVELGEEAGTGISARHVSRGCAFGDFDNDGDLDVLIMNQNEAPSLLRNDASRAADAGGAAGDAPRVCALSPPSPLLAATPSPSCS